MRIKTMNYQEQRNLHLPQQVRTAQLMNEIAKENRYAVRVFVSP
jgi:hypothetical protein